MNDRTRRAETYEMLGRISRHMLDDESHATGTVAALDALGRFLDADRVRVCEYFGETFELCEEWCAPGVSPARTLQRRFPGTDYVWMISPLLRGETMTIGSLDELPASAEAARATIGRAGISSLLLVPLVHRGVTTGWIGLEGLRGPRSWSDEDVSVTRLGAEIIAIGRARARAQAALSEAKEAAEAASQSKSRFLAHMSHELRTPLNGVIGMVDLLAGTELGERQRRYTKVARASASLMLSVIDDVLDFSKIEANKLELEESELSVASLLEEVATLLELTAEDKGLDLSRSSSPKLVETLAGDPARIRQILLNLVSNAIKFTPAGEVCMRASVDRDDGAVVTVRFEVSDTGAGIPESARGRLFLPFIQGDASTTRRYGGSGLGLAICRELTERMGGAIGVESEPGHGSTFWFTVPLRRARGDHDEPVRETGQRSPEPRAPRRSGSGRRVLVVEDSDFNAEVAHDVLASAGYAVDRAADGREAVETARARTYDAVLMDCQLPEMDGFEATRRIREGERARGAPRVPIIALTASATREDHDRCFACDMDDFVAKPLDAARLLRLIAAHVEGRGRPAPAGRRPIADLGQALARVQGNTALLSRLAVQLREVAPAAVDELARAVESRDASRTRFLAHRLTSQVATFGAEQAVIDLDGLRAAISDGRFADAERRVDELRVTVDRLLGELANRAVG